MEEIALTPMGSAPVSQKAAAISSPLVGDSHCEGRGGEEGEGERGGVGTRKPPRLLSRVTATETGGAGERMSGRARLVDGECEGLLRVLAPEPGQDVFVGSHHASLAVGDHYKSVSLLNGDGGLLLDHAREHLGAAGERRALRPVACAVATG